MDVIRRNTDYAIRLMVGLASHYGQEAVSVKLLAEEVDVSYDLACKLLQKLNKARFVKSRMGRHGGFMLGREASKISVVEIIKVIQGQLSLNRCVLPGSNGCSREAHCTLRGKLSELQRYVEDYLGGLKLSDLLNK